MAPFQISRRTLRRFILGQQGLWPGRRWRGKAGLDQALRAGSVVQVDPLQIIARTDLVLQAESRITPSCSTICVH
jgi:uncharacterized protein YcaQ